MGRLFRREEVEATRKWLQNHFDSYPDGIEKVYEGYANEGIHIKLDHPLDVEFLVDIVQGHGYVAELERDEDDTRVLNVYTEIYDDGQDVARSLQTVFREQSDIVVASNPVQGQSVHNRLLFLTDYLRGKFDRSKPT